MTMTSQGPVAAPAADADEAAGRALRRSARPPKRTWWRSQSGLPFVAPFAILFALVFIIPIVYASYLSLFAERMIGGNEFVGLGNYVQLMQDSQFWDGVRRVGIFTAVQVPVMLISAAAIALALDSRRLYGTKFVRISVFLPYAVPAIVSTLLWGFMLGVRYGLFGNINEAFGTSINPFSPDLTLVSIGVMVTWIFTGYNVLIFYSALQAVPRETYEAAAIDGANEFQIVRRIKLPALRGSFVITVIFSIIGTFQLFNEPRILPSIVANSGITTYYTPNIYAYNLAFTGSQQGYAASLAIVMALMTMAIAYAVQIRGMRNALD